MGGGTNRGEAEATFGEGGVKRALCDAALQVVGRCGLGNTHVQLVVQEAGLPRQSFYEHFRDLQHCFMAAYEDEAWKLSADILRAGRAGDTWPAGLRSALSVLLQFVVEQPHTATALICEGGAAGSITGPIHNSVLKRLSRALDSARHQPGSLHSAPPLTAELMVGAINNTLQGLLVKGEAARAPTLLDDYVYLVMLAFFGEETAFRGMNPGKGKG